MDVLLSEKYTVIIASLVCLWLLNVLRNYATKRKYNQLIWKLPGPRTGWPLIGDANIFWDMKQPLHVVVLDKLISIQRKYQKEGLFRLYLGPTPAVFLCEPEAIETILSSNHVPYLHKPSSFKVGSSFFGSGLIMKSGHDWKRMRRLYNPSFHQKSLDQFVPNINRQAKNLCGKLSGKHSDIKQLVGPLVLDLIFETSMGTDLSSINETENFYYHKLDRLIQLIITRFFSPWLWSDFIYNKLEAGRETSSLVNVLHEITMTVIRKAKERRLKDDSPEKSRKNFLDLFLDYHLRDKILTEDEIRQELDTLVFVGSDAASTALSFAIYSLGLHEDIQEKVYEELVSIIGDNCEEEVTVEDMKRMNLLDFVIKETLRLYTPVPIIGRELKEDLIINGHVIPKETPVFIFLYGLHRNEDVFPDAETFDPMRWAPERSVGRRSHAFSAFSSGPRNCVGQRVVINEMKVFLAHIIRRFKIISSPSNTKNISVQMDLSIKPTHALEASFLPRKQY